jgi:cell division protein FtsB
MKQFSQSKFVVFVTLVALLGVAALTFVFTQSGVAQEIKPVQRPVQSTVQEKQAAQIRELMADVAELKNQISLLRQPLAQLKALGEDHVSKADFDKQVFEAKLRLTTLEGVAKDYKTHTHQNLKLDAVFLGDKGQLIVTGPNAPQRLKFPLSGPIQP